MSYKLNIFQHDKTIFVQTLQVFRLSHKLILIYLALPSFPR